MKEEPAITNNSGYIESAGHVAALYQNELYDRATSRAGTAMLQRFTDAGRQALAVRVR